MNKIVKLRGVLSRVDKPDIETFFSKSDKIVSACFLNQPILILEEN